MIRGTRSRLFTFMTTLHVPDPDTLQRAARGDAAAWDSLLGVWIPVVLAWCRRLGGPDVQAEDLAHDVFVTVFDQISHLREPRAFPAWIYQITRRAAGRARRGVRAHEALDLHQLTAPSRATDVVAGATVLRLLQRLPEEQHEAMVLCLVEERSREEVAELLGIPVGTVKSRLRLGAARFRELADQEGLTAALEESVRWPT